MSRDKLIELFVECYDNCDLRSKVAIHNTYERENGYDYEKVIESNDEDFFNLFFEGKPMRNPGRNTRRSFPTMWM